MFVLKCLKMKFSKQGFGVYKQNKCVYKISTVVYGFCFLLQPIPPTVTTYTNTMIDYNKSTLG